MQANEQAIVYVRLHDRRAIACDTKASQSRKQSALCREQAALCEEAGQHDKACHYAKCADEHHERAVMYTSQAILFAKQLIASW